MFQSFRLNLWKMAKIFTGNLLVMCQKLIIAFSWDENGILWLLKMSAHKILVCNFTVATKWDCFRLKFSTMLSLCHTHTCSVDVFINVWMILFKQCCVVNIVASSVSVDYLIICGFGFIWIACGTTLLSFVRIHLSAFHLKWQSHTASHVPSIKYMNVVRSVSNNSDNSDWRRHLKFIDTCIELENTIHV